MSAALGLVSKIVTTPADHLRSNNGLSSGDEVASPTSDNDGESFLSATNSQTSLVDDDQDDGSSGVDSDSDVEGAGLEDSMYSDADGGTTDANSEYGDSMEVASDHTQREFRKIFSNSDVPGAEKVIKAYVCAQSKEILYHGKMFVTAHYVCFHSRLFVVQKLVIPFADITKIEPKMTMTFIPNAIAIRTRSGDRYTFASFSNRNRSIGVLRQLRNSPPHTGTDTSDARSAASRAGSPMSVNGDAAAGGGANGAELGGDAQGSGSANPASSRLRSLTGLSGRARSSSGVSDGESGNHTSSALSPSATNTGTAADMSAPAPSAAAGGSAAAAGGSKWPVENLGPAEHAKTSAPEEEENERNIGDETIKAPMGVVANLMFGKDTTWYKHFLLDIEKNRDLSQLPAFPDLKQGSQRTFSYVKPLNGPVGPKQTTCNSTEKIEHWDFNSYIEVITTTATPDVPSGSSFTTLTRTVLSWGDNNSTNIRMGTWLVWTAKSWLKGPIEKGAFDGQVSYGKSFNAELIRKLSGSAGGRGRTASTGASGSKSAAASSTSSSAAPEKVKRSSADKHSAQAIKEWQQLCTILGGVAGVLFLLLVWVWARSGRRVAHTRQEEQNLLRIQEELDLWEWIDNRRVAGVRKHQSLSDANIEEAIAATEKKLANLKAGLIL